MDECMQKRPSPPMVLSYMILELELLRTIAEYGKRHFFQKVREVCHQPQKSIKGHNATWLRLGKFQAHQGSNSLCVCPGKRACWWLSSSSCRGYWFSSLSLQMKMWIGTRTTRGEPLVCGMRQRVSLADLCFTVVEDPQFGVRLFMAEWLLWAKISLHWVKRTETVYLGLVI